MEEPDFEIVSNDAEKLLLVAATALRHSATLVTGNTQHFTRISRLRLLDWLKR